MKRAVILHGTDGNPEINWLPWLKAQLVDRNFDVYVPLLPDNHTPNRQKYDEYLQNSSWDFSNNLLVGHSSGATTVLNLLQSDWFPKVDTVVLVGTFLNEKLLKSVDWYEPGQFGNLFPDSFDVEKIKSKAKSFIFIHGDDDPYCDIHDAKDFCDQVGGAFISVPEGKHLSGNRVELPEILSVLGSKEDV